MSHTKSRRHRVFYEKRDVLKFFGMDFTGYAVFTREEKRGADKKLSFFIFLEVL